MPPLPGQKGTGKKGRHSRSRNTTPTVVGSVLGSDGFTSFLELPSQPFRTIEDFSNTYANGIPMSKELDTLLDRLKNLVHVVEARGSVCDKGMRLLAQTRKDRLEEIETERREEESKERLKRDILDEEERGRNKLSKFKKRKESSNTREKRPHTHGSHMSTTQDGSNPHFSSPVKDKKQVKKMSQDRGSPSSSLSPPAPSTPVALDILDHEGGKEDEDSSTDEQQQSVTLAVPHFQTFGDDPSTFPDPTVYEIPEVKPGMTRDQLKEIYSVAYFPKTDLEDLIPGSPPDKDFSNAKPANQVQANTFATYIEPYFRPFDDQDIAFLRERGDRITPFVIPRRGKRHYSEIWAEEDGTLTSDSSQYSRERLPLNQPRGSMNRMNDEIAESDNISTGPILSRLLSALRPEHRTCSTDLPIGTSYGAPNGDSHLEANSEFTDNSGVSMDVNNQTSATRMPESNTETWKKASHPNLDYAQIDERIKLELRHIGFLPLDSEPDYDAHNDDDVAARLRYLQAKLKQTAILNGARKARLQELVKERMAHQEFSTILEDLDGQVQAAYLKRTRTLGKSKKAKRPGGTNGINHTMSNVSASGMARPGIGDMTKTLMERRRKWIDTIGGVLDPEAKKIRRVKDPGSTIFGKEVMIDFVKREEAAWEEGDDDDE